MASLRRLPESKYWIACFTDRDGRRRQRSTSIEAKGTENRRMAQKVADTYERAGRTSRTTRQVQRVCADLCKELSGEAAPQYTTRGWIDHWIESHKAVTSAGSLSRYQGQADRFLEYMGDRAEQQLGDLVRSDVQAYRDTRLAKVALKTVKHEIDFLRRAFRGAVLEGVLVESPADGVTLPKMTGNRQTARRSFTVTELGAIMDNADPEWRSMVAFGLYSGQRLGDIARLTWANLDMENGVLRLTTQKTGATLVIPIADPLRTHIAALPLPEDPAAPIHPHAFDMVERHGKVAGLSSEFRRTLVAAGLAEKTPHRKTADGQGRGGRRRMSSVSYHSLRHTATSAMKNAGVNNDVVMATVGHESEAISREYTHAELSAMQAAVNALPDILSEGVE